MPSPSSEPRTNSLAFAKTDCHTCKANQSRCDRNRPRCSSCSSKNIICGGYPVQLKWSNSKSTRLITEKTDDPFHLDPLSFKASIHIKQRNNPSHPHKFQKFRFITEKVPGRDKTSPSTKKCEYRTEQRSVCPTTTQSQALIQKENTVTNNAGHQYPLGSLLHSTLDDGSYGEMRHYIILPSILICL